jgi:hypothetical protein
LFEPIIRSILVAASRACCERDNFKSNFTIVVAKLADLARAVW